MAPTEAQSVEEEVRSHEQVQVLQPYYVGESSGESKFNSKIHEILESLDTGRMAGLNQQVHNMKS